MRQQLPSRRTLLQQLRRANHRRRNRRQSSSSAAQAQRGQRAPRRVSGSGKGRAGGNDRVRPVQGRGRDLPGVQKRVRHAAGQGGGHAALPRRLLCVQPVQDVSRQPAVLPRPAREGHASVRRLQGERLPRHDHAPVARRRRGGDQRAGQDGLRRPQAGHQPARQLAVPPLRQDCLREREAACLRVALAPQVVCFFFS